MPDITAADDAATARIRGRVATPASTGCDPHNVRIVGGSRDDEGIIAVCDDDGARVGRCPVTQATLDRSDLSHTIELVARKVEIDEHGRIHVGRNGGHMHLVDFEGGPRRALALHERRQDTRGHVVAVDVRGDATGAFERRTHHACRRRLAVGAGDDHGCIRGGQFTEELRGDTQRNLAANHAARTATEGSGREAGSAACSRSKARAHRQVMRRIRHASTLSHAGRWPRRRRISISPTRTRPGTTKRVSFLVRHAGVPLTCTDSYALHIDVTYAISA